MFDQIYMLEEFLFIQCDSSGVSQSSYVANIERNPIDPTIRFDGNFLRAGCKIHHSLAAFVLRLMLGVFWVGLSLRRQIDHF